MSKRGMKQGRLYTIREACSYLGVSIWCVRSLIWRGTIQVVRLPGGKKQYLDIRDMDDLIEKGKERVE